MTILSGSRYSDGTLVRMPNSSGTYQQAVLRIIDTSISDFTLYIWKSGDRPDVVANTLLGDPSLWWAIFDINPELIYPLNIPVGSVIRIPQSPVLGQGTLIQ